MRRTWLHEAFFVGMNRILANSFLFLCLLPVAATRCDDDSVLPCATTSLTPPQAERLFVTEVLPRLKSKCFACHGDDANNSARSPSTPCY